MKAKYFKKYHFDGKEIMCVVKIKSENSLKVYNDRITKNNHLDEEYYLNTGYEESTVKEFETFYAATMKNFNEILN